MTSTYDTQIFDRPFEASQTEQSVSRLVTIHSDIHRLATLCFKPVPNYQILKADVQDAFDHKLLVTARDAEDSDKLIGFVSAVFLPIEGLDNTLLHTGLTVVHPDYRKSGVVHQLFATLFLHLLGEFPEGLWLSTRAAVITSLVHIAKHTTKVYPSPEWEAKYPEGPSGTHLLIAKEISKRHRSQMLVAPDAKLDEKTFVFMGSNNTEEGQAFIKDVDDTQYWHIDKQSSEFYRRLMRRGMGDEVLQVSFLDPEHLLRVASAPRYRDQWQGKFSKL
ncbi:unnamed protein product [Discula destructiva]